MTSNKHTAGFVAIDALLSGVILVVTVLGTFGILQSVMAANQSVIRGDREASDSVRLERWVNRYLVSAATSTLEAVPMPDGDAQQMNPVPEPMLDDVVYENIRFRLPVTFANGATVYQPPVGEAPYAFFLEKNGEGNPGELVFHDGTRKQVIARNVTGVNFVRSGSIVATTVSIQVAAQETAQTRWKTVLRSK